MNEIYYDAENVGSYGGVDRLQRAANASKAATKTWLKVQRTYTLHKPVRKRFSTRPYKTAGIDQQWQADIVEMIPYAEVNNGYRYLLTVIDIFSRYAWAVPLLNKTGREVTAAFRGIFAQGRVCRRLKTDQGREFENRHFLNMQNVRFFTVK